MSKFQEKYAKPRRYSDLSDAICKLCDRPHSEHNRRCREMAFSDKEARRCLWDAGHTEPCGFRPTRKERRTAA